MCCLTRPLTFRNAGRRFHLSYGVVKKLVVDESSSVNIPLQYLLGLSSKMVLSVILSFENWAGK
jgi:hypothetical protein